MDKEIYGLLGEKLGHSYSKQIHEYFGGYEYNMFPMPPEDVEGFITGRSYRAINVTIPYKEKVMPFLDTISGNARAIGSVNTIVKDSTGALHGYNTDKYGFTQLVRRAGIDIAGKKCLILGSGGSSKTVRSALTDLNARQIVIISRSGEDNYSNLDKHADAEVIVNTTPVGMYPNTGIAPVDLSRFPKCSGVLDLIYNPRKTALLLDAERRGIPCANGLHMLVAQAKLASELFRDTKLDDSVIVDVRNRIEFDTTNLLLIGMPGCGKSTLGSALAQRLNREFVDTDELIISNTGRTPADIISNDGESAFRAIETNVISDTCKRSGLVIATGGGVVTRPENIDPMRQNSIIFFIDRPLDMLEISTDRPLSKTRENNARLYETREKLYKATADFRIENSGTIASAISEIMTQYANSFKE